MIRKSLRMYVLGAVSAVLLGMILGIPTLAQNSKGTIKGRVMDNTGGVLQGAQISLEPKSLTLATDVLGEFFIRDLDPGSYTLTITYVGFTPVTKTVDVAAGQVATVETNLQVQSQNEQVLVVADRASAEAEAVNRERTADNIVQV
jgi:Carboxypeptidase regulatory-like domain